MTQDLATVRQAVKQKTGLVNPSKPITKPGLREKSDLSAVRHIVQLRASLGKPPEPMVRPLASLKLVTGGQIITEPKTLPLEPPNTAIRSDVHPKQVHASGEQVDHPGTPPMEQSNPTIETDTTKPIARNRAVQGNNVDDNMGDRQAAPDVEELSIVDMLRSAVNQIDTITDDSKNSGRRK